MSMTRNKAQIFGMSLLLFLGASGCNSQTRMRSASTSTAQKEAALRDLRDSGVISNDEYQMRLTQLRGGSHQATSTLTAASTQATAHTWHMKKVEVQTMTGWDAIPNYGIPAREKRQVDALTMLIPSDWQFHGGVIQTKVADCNFTEGRVGFVALSPDQKTGMMSFPRPVSIWSNDPSILREVQQDNAHPLFPQDCKIEQPAPLPQQMPSLVSDFLALLGGKGHASGPAQSVPGADEKLRPAVESANRELASQGAHLDVEVARIPMSLDNAPDAGEAYLMVMSTVRSSRLPNGATVWTTDYPMQVATVAPQGKMASLDPMFAAMMDSIQLNPDYQRDAMQVSANIQSMKMQTRQRLMGIAQQMQLDNLNAARQQATIRQDAQNYSNHVISSVTANRSAALEHSSQQFSLYMGDQAEYRDPNGGTVRLPSGSTHAWASQTGNTSEYILTDSASYNPNGQVGSAGWTQMQMVR